MGLRIVEHDQDDCFLVKFVGSIDENSLFNLKLPPNRIIRVDFESVKNINSSGISLWIQWIKKHENLKLYLINVSRNVVRQLGIVKNFLPVGSVVESFFVPYYDEIKNVVVDVKYERGPDYNNGKLKGIKKVKNEQGQNLEIDINPDKYFKFLEQYS